MKQSITIAFLLAAACSVGDPDSAPVPELTGYGSSAVLFEHIDFEGDAVSMETTGYVGDEWNDRISSVWVPDGVSVRLYEHDNFGGAAIEINAPGVADLRDHGLNDGASSIEVIGGGEPPPPPPRSTNVGDHLDSDGVLHPNQYIENGEGRLTYQGDGNLVLLGRHGQFRFASNTAGTSPGFTVLQGDGNLVIYDGGGNPVWASGTDGHPGADVQLQRGCRGRNGEFAFCADDDKNDTFLWVRWTSAAARAATGDPLRCVFGCTLAFFPD